MSESSRLELLDTEQLAARLGICRRSVHNLRVRHHIPWVKLGRTVRFNPVDVEAVIRKNLTVKAARKGGDQ